jgi:hypothetical protein
MSRSAENPKRHRKSPMVAALLQCIPLLAATSCMANAASNQRLGALPLYLWWSVLLGGFGYLYLHKWLEVVLVLLLGPIIAIAGCFVVLSSSFDYENCPSPIAGGGYNCNQGVPGADARTAGVGLLVGALVTLTALDAGRLAEQWNLEIDSSKATESNAEALP